MTNSVQFWEKKVVSVEKFLSKSLGKDVVDNNSIILLVTVL